MAAKRPESGASHRLAYRRCPEIGEGVVLVEEESAAEYWNRVYRALEEAKTWSDFRRLMPRDEYSRLVKSMFDEDGKPRPRGDALFDRLDIPGYGDGDYPPWSAKSLERLIPVDLLERHAKREWNMRDGAWWVILESEWTALKQALEGRGFTLVERNDLAHFR